MNTIHSVSSTSLVRSSEAVAVRKSFSFRSWMLRVMLVMMMVVGGKVAWGQTMVTDVLNRALTGVTGTSYSNWSGKTSISSAVYAGNSAGGNNSIQLRSSNNSGIVTTTSGGNVKKVTVVWNSNTASGRTLNIYGKNTAYSSASDLYNASTQGTLLGTIVCGTSTELTISGDYAYIGMRSNSNAMYLTSISIDWETSSSNYSVLYDANGGTGTMTDGNSPYGSGATVTVLANTFTAPDGMDFNGWNTAVDGSGTYYDEEDTFTITENTTLYAQWITSGCRSLSFSSMGYTNGRVLNGTQINISSIITVTFNKASGT
ncbi:MAG: InlB B-repeat-containing protein, partial [Bacteroidales bacterium]|nr:InlB B-repeat-containing protein [Bacteroidales bacterium]